MQGGREGERGEKEIVREIFSISQSLSLSLSNFCLVKSLLLFMPFALSAFPPLYLFPCLSLSHSFTLSTSICLTFHLGTPRMGGAHAVVQISIKYHKHALVQQPAPGYPKRAVSTFAVSGCTASLSESRIFVRFKFPERLLYGAKVSYDILLPSEESLMLALFGWTEFQKKGINKKIIFMVFFP